MNNCIEFLITYPLCRHLMGESINRRAKGRFDQTCTVPVFAAATMTSHAGPLA